MTDSIDFAGQVAIVRIHHRRSVGGVGDRAVHRAGLDLRGSVRRLRPARCRHLRWLSPTRRTLSQQHVYPQPV